MTGHSWKRKRRAEEATRDSLRVMGHIQTRHLALMSVYLILSRVTRAAGAVPVSSWAAVACPTRVVTNEDETRRVVLLGAWVRGGGVGNGTDAGTDDRHPSSERPGRPPTMSHPRAAPQPVTANQISGLLRRGDHDRTFLEEEATRRGSDARLSPRHGTHSDSASSAHVRLPDTIAGHARRRGGPGVIVGRRRLSDARSHKRGRDQAGRPAWRVGARRGRR